MRESVALALLATFACEVAEVEIERAGFATIPGQDGEMRIEDLEIVLAEVEDENDIEPEDISDARLERLTLTVLEPAGADLSFVDEVEVFAEAPGLERVRIAYLDGVPADTRKVELELDDVDLGDYIAAPTVTFVALIDGVAPPANVRVRGDALLDVGVTTRGACNHI